MQRAEALPCKEGTADVACRHQRCQKKENGEEQLDHVTDIAAPAAPVKHNNPITGFIHLTRRCRLAISPRISAGTVKIPLL